MRFSILIPSRGRPEQFKRILQSIMLTTADLSNVEILSVIDYDEPFYDAYNKIAESMSFYNFEMIVVDRFECFPNYYNDLATYSKGEILWAINDDCLIDTDAWDVIAYGKAEHFALRNPSRVFYGDVGDTTRNFNGNGNFSCFPMLSRQAYETLGYFFNSKIKAWGTDKFLKHVFEQSGAGIIDMLDITVQHSHIQDDETHTVLINRLKSHAGQECQVDYSEDIKRLRERIAST